MKLLITATMMLSLAAFAGAQQVKLLEDAAGQTPAQNLKPAGAPPLPGSAAAPAAPSKPVKVEVASSSTTVKAAAKKPGKKKTHAFSVKKSTAAVAAAPVQVPGPAPAEKPLTHKDTTLPAVLAPVKTTAPAAGVVIIKPSEEKPAVFAVPVKPAEAKPVPATGAKPAEAVKPAAAALVKPAEAKPVPATGAKPAEAVKPAAAAPIKPVEPKAAPIAAKPAEAVKPAAALPAIPVQPEAGPKKAPVAASAVSGGQSGGFAVAKKHTVSRGETLWDLSRKYYGDPFKWGKIYNANTDNISNPDRIYPREEIVIPEITEIVKPSPKPETVTEPGVPGSEEGVAAALPIPAEGTNVNGMTPAASATVSPEKAAAPIAVKGKVLDYEPTDLSSDMPEDQKEWSEGNTVIVPENWKEDGVIVAKVGTGEDNESEGLTAPGEKVRIKVRDASAFKPGEIIFAYMKGDIAHDKKTDKELGLELQKTGSLEVLKVQAPEKLVIARILEASTSVDNGQVIKK